MRQYIRQLLRSPRKEKGVGQNRSVSTSSPARLTTFSLVLTAQANNTITSNASPQEIDSRRR